MSDDVVEPCIAPLGNLCLDTGCWDADRCVVPRVAATSPPARAEDDTEGLAWGEMPYDGKTPREVVDDYVLIRGDLSTEHARTQLARWIERYAAAYAATIRAETLAPVLALADEWDSCGCRPVCWHPMAAHVIRVRAEGA